VDRDPKNADWQQGLAASHQNIGRILADQGDLTAALASYQSCTRIREKLAADDPSNGLTRRYLAIADEEIGDILLLKSDAIGALEKFRLAVARFRALATENPENLLLRGDLGGALKELGDAERLDNEFESGLTNLNEALSIFGTLTKKDPNNLFWQYLTALTQRNLGVLAATQKRWAEATRLEEVAEEALINLSRQDPSSVSFIQDLAICDIRIGQAAEANGDEEKAIGRFRAASNLLEPLVNKKSPRREWIGQFARASYLLGVTLHSPAESQIVLQKGRDALLTLEQENFLSAVDKTTLTDIQNALNRNKGQGAQN
jgi:tetratricopeptide (TPR) repeat protein